MNRVAEKPVKVPRSPRWQRLAGMAAALVVLLLAFTPARMVVAAGQTDQPDPGKVPAKAKERQFVYGLTLANGKGYDNTFSPKVVDTIYLIANKDNIFSPRRTLVYYWPITREYMADWFGENETVKGALEVYRGNKLVLTVRPEPYVFSYPEGSMSEAFFLLCGDAAKAESAAFKKRIETFYDAVSRYYEAQIKYQKEIDAFTARPKGKEPPVAPAEPEPPKGYVTDPQDGYILNLPVGTYNIQFKDENGKVVEGSKKKLVVFAERRRGIAYQIIPEEKWTMPERTDDITQVIYSTGKRILFFKPFEAKEYNKLFYAKLSGLANPWSGRGGENRWGWVYLLPKEKQGLLIQIKQKGQVVREVTEKHYYVQQRPGYSLGYDIVEFDPKKMEGRQPSFTAYRVELPKKGDYRLQLVDRKGKVVPGSMREIRPVRENGGVVLLLISLLPLGLGGGVWIWRRRLGGVTLRARVEHDICDL